MGHISGAQVASLVALLVLVIPLGNPVGSTQDSDSAESASVLDECTTITESGRYVFENDLPRTGTTTSSVCIEIAADDVVIDGNGHTFTGRGVSNTTGIYASEVSNLTIKNVSVGSWHRAIHLRKVSNGTVENVEVNSSVYGLNLAQADGVTVRGTSVINNFVGVVGRNSGNTEFRNNSVKDNEVDFDGGR